MEKMFDMPTCGGCRTCELACSFKHTGEFAPAVSSLKIVDKKDGVGFFVSLVDGMEGHRLACDGCKDRPSRLCVDFCKEKEDLDRMIDDLMKEGS
jgi:Fe-S-cluster-containing hydrogenase component 2